MAAPRRTPSSGDPAFLRLIVLTQEPFALPACSVLQVSTGQGRLSCPRLLAHPGQEPYRVPDPAVGFCLRTDLLAELVEKRLLERRFQISQVHLG